MVSCGNSSLLAAAVTLTFAQLPSQCLNLALAHWLPYIKPIIKETLLVGTTLPVLSATQ